MLHHCTRPGVPAYFPGTAQFPKLLLEIFRIVIVLIKFHIMYRTFPCASNHLKANNLILLYICTFCLSIFLIVLLMSCCFAPLPYTRGIRISLRNRTIAKLILEIFQVITTFIKFRFIYIFDLRFISNCPPPS